MVHLIRLYQDLTYIRKKRKVQDNKLLVSKKEGYTPDISQGMSIFKERKPAWKFWRGGKDIAILLDGCPKALTLESPKPQYDTDGKLLSTGEPSLNLQFGTREDTKRFISKVVAKDKADQKPITNIQFIIIAMLLGLVLVLQFMSMRGTTI
jgi:hypothetical protein